MSKVYVLIDYNIDGSKDIIGVVSKKETAEKYFVPYYYNYIEVELDDPKLLNRIAKESENKNK